MEDTESLRLLQTDRSNMNTPPSDQFANSNSIVNENFHVTDKVPEKLGDEGVISVEEQPNVVTMRDRIRRLRPGRKNNESQSQLSSTQVSLLYKVKHSVSNLELLVFNV